MESTRLKEFLKGELILRNLNGLVELLDRLNEESFKEGRNVGFREVWEELGLSQNDLQEPVQLLNTGMDERYLRLECLKESIKSIPIDSNQANERILSRAKEFYSFVTENK
jgi:hypothetical protein